MVAAAAWPGWRLRASAGPDAILRPPAPAFYETPPRRGAILCGGGVYRRPARVLYPVLSRTHGTSAIIQHCGRGGRDFVDGHHWHRVRIQPERESPTAPSVDDPELRRCLGVSRGASRGGRNWLGQPRTACDRNHRLVMPCIFATVR